MEIEGTLIIAEPLNLTGLVVVSGAGGGGGGTTNYNDLSNKPAINGTTLSGNKTSHQLGVADEVHTHTVAQITDFPTLAPVATSGSYSDLTGTPAIPTSTSDLNNDSGFITINDVPAQQQSDWNEANTTSPAYIQHKPTIPAAQVNADWNAVSGVEEILNKPTLATVATTGNYNDLTNKPTIPSVTDKADKVSGAVSGDPAGLDANGNLTDSGLSATNVSDAVSKRHSHTNKAVLDMVPASLGTAGQALCVNGNADGLEFKTISGGGGLSDYNFTHTADSTVSGSVTMTAAADQRCTRMVNTSADLAVTFAINNGADNYLWIKNTGGSDIDITISAVTYNGNAVANVYIPTDGITVAAGMVCEIGIICNADGAFITSRSDLSL